MLIYVTAFAASFANIFLRAGQQLNVAHHRVYWVPPTSMCMAIAEYYSFGAIIHSVVSDGSPFWTILSLGLGGGIGAVLAMLWHKKLREHTGGPKAFKAETRVQ